MVGGNYTYYLPMTVLFHRALFNSSDHRFTKASISLAVAHAQKSNCGCNLLVSYSEQYYPIGVCYRCMFPPLSCLSPGTISHQCAVSQPFTSLLDLLQSLILPPQKKIASNISRNHIHIDFAIKGLGRHSVSIPSMEFRVSDTQPPSQHVLSESLWVTQLGSVLSKLIICRLDH